MSDSIALDPAPEEWLSEERLQKLQLELGTSVDLLEHSGVLKQVLKTWIRRELSDPSSDEAQLAWARNQWGHRFETLYLERKDTLDQASCRMLRVTDAFLALELYHRLKAGEATFEQLSMQFAEGGERFHGGLYKLQPLDQLPGGLGKILRKLHPGELTNPLTFGKWSVLVQLEELVPATRGEETEQRLMEAELDDWLNGMAAVLEARLGSDV